MIRFKRRALYAFLIGCVMSFIWLLPVFGPPVDNAFEGQITPMRVLRLVMPLLVWILIRRRAFEALLNGLLRKVPVGVVPISVFAIFLVALVFALIPLVAGGLSKNVPFIVSAVMPIVLGGIVLIGFSLLEKPDFRNLALGIGFGATCFLCCGIATTGFAASSYFGRPRVLMNFIHPIYTASVVLGSMIFAAMMGKDFSSRIPKYLRVLLILSYLSFSFFLLFVSQSRNTLVAVLVGVVCAFIARRGSMRIRLGIVLFFVLGQVLFYAIVLILPEQNPVWSALNTFSSYRLGNYRNVLLSLVSQGGGGLIANASRLQVLNNYVGFAAVDSVFLSFLINYGLGGLISLVTLFLIAGWRLSLSRESAIAFGALCAIIILFSFDATGATPSNLVLFVIFAFIIRASIRPADAAGLV